MNRLIIEDLQAAFGIRVQSFVSVSGGYLNKKWRVETDAGELLVKQYSHERFNRRKLTEIEQALERQMILFDAGIPCPRVWKAGDTIIRRPSEEIDYMAMDFLPGASVGPENVNLTQMESLGGACRQMHEAFHRLPVGGVKGYPIKPAGLIDSLHASVRRGREECPEDAPQAYREAIDLAEKWAARMDCSLPNRLLTSIAHEDFTPDNMLFSANALTAILDFDRNQFSFPLHDVGRALISLAYHDGRIDEERVRAFRKGYGGLSDEAVRDALKLTACIEIPWWIQIDCFKENSRKVRRFVDEMLFLMNWIS